MLVRCGAPRTVLVLRLVWVVCPVPDDICDNRRASRTWERDRVLCGRDSEDCDRVIPCESGLPVPWEMLEDSSEKGTGEGEPDGREFCDAAGLWSPPSVEP